jgi:hypothetical protein
MISDNPAIFALSWAFNGRPEQDSNLRPTA